MNWMGKELVTIGDITNAIGAVTSKEEAQLFMQEYRKDNPLHAAENVGYLIGYFDRETRARLYDWFGVAHPVFGRHEPTNEEAFKAGIQRALEGATCDRCGHKGLQALLDSARAAWVADICPICKGKRWRNPPMSAELAPECLVLVGTL